MKNKNNERTKVTVSFRAVVARVRRALAKQDTLLRRARSQQMQCDVGEWFLVSTRNNVIGHDVDIEELARELGVLHGHEVMAEEESA